MTRHGVDIGAVSLLLLQAVVLLGSAALVYNAVLGADFVEA